MKDEPVLKTLVDDNDPILVPETPVIEIEQPVVQPGAHKKSNYNDLIIAVVLLLLIVGVLAYFKMRSVKLSPDVN